MPNWCSNGVTLRHADPAMIDRVIKGKEGILMEFLPTPQALLDTVSGSVPVAEEDAHLAQQKANLDQYGAKDWYDWNVSNWGTKWDFALENVERHEDGSVTASFDSAWAPPIEAYRQLCAMGFEIEAMYYEPGMGFVGKFTGNEEDFDDDYYEYHGQSSDTVRDFIGEELDDYFGISEQMADWEEENQED